MLKVNWRPSDRDLRFFGLVLWIGFGLIGGLLFWRGHREAATIVWAAAGAVGLLAVVLPRAARPFYAAWMGVAFVVGSVVSRVILALFFFGVLTPIGLFFRLRGRDALRLK